MPTSQQDPEHLREQVAQGYGVELSEVRVVFAPYRICPLGAHIDHQWGQVTAMALDRGVTLAYAPSRRPAAQLRSQDFSGEVHVDLDDIGDPKAGDWGNYLRGAARALRLEYDMKQGIVGMTAGSVAEGGLSSSAAVSVAYLLALQDVNQLEVTREENVALVQRIENDYLGLRIGILDQSAILFSRHEALTVINCADVTHQLVERPSCMASFAVLIAFSGVRKPLVGTDYNLRVDECSAAARVLLEAAGRPTEPARLGAVTSREYDEHGHLLTGVAARRAAHFFSEMERVQQGIGAWRRGDLAALGQLINQSGTSSIDNYQCGAPPLVDLYHLLVQTEGVYGARFSGAGFRGCCLALVRPDAARQAAERVQQEYCKLHPDLAAGAWTMLCHTGDGARIVSGYG